ncbi:hypothetical protein AB0M12_22530 [Nocardia vinacea]|uniref:hypothetical protein n=1 Tax=Nocardia vinacea TaxID=96468 RepID=UPI00341DC6E7
MTNYSEEIERIFDEHDRRSRILREELVEIEQRSAERGREFVEQINIEMREFWEEHAEELEKAQAEAEERERREVEARAEQERLAAEAREQRDAIARSIAARRANDVVTPIDEDDDPESEYYRRKSWLV